MGLFIKHIFPQNHYYIQLKHFKIPSQMYFVVFEEQGPVPWNSALRNPYSSKERRELLRPNDFTLQMIAQVQLEQYIFILSSG